MFTTGLLRKVSTQFVHFARIPQSGLMPLVIVRRSLTVIDASSGDISLGSSSGKNAATLSVILKRFWSTAMPTAILTSVFELEYCVCAYCGAKGVGYISPITLP